MSRRFLVLAAALGLVHAGFSLYWALGGTWLLETLGSRVVEQFSGRLGLLVPVVLVKVIAALAPVALEVARWPLRPATRGLAWLAAAVLVAWGGLNTVVGQLVLAGVVRPDGGYDRAGMIGHAWLWDPLFLAWGLALAAGLWLSHRAAGS